VAHLKRSQSTGRLLKNAAGHLVRQCSSTTTTTEEPQNACNNCDPPLHDSYAVTLDGLGGVFGFLNGSHVVQWVENCRWQVLAGSQDCPGGSVRLEYEEDTPDGDFWYVWAACGGGCVKFWRRLVIPYEPCHPTGAYSEWSCYEDNCPGWPPLTGCPESNGATCSVSEVGE